MQVEDKKLYIVRDQRTHGYVVGDEIYDRAIGLGSDATIGEEVDGTVQWRIVEGKLVRSDGTEFELIDADDQERLSGITIGERHK